MKKIFSLLSAALMAATVLAADFAPTAVYSVGGASTLGSSWTDKHQTTNYFEVGDTVIFNAYICYQSQGSSKQAWTGSAGNGSTDAPDSWVATDCFKGRDAWFSSEPKCATVRNSRTYLYNVTNCSEVRVLGDNKGENREFYLKAYPLHNGVRASVPADSVCNTANTGSFVLAINGLNVADTFQIVVTTNTGSNSNLYEIAFVSAPAATNVATLKSIAVDGTPIEGFSAAQLSYSVELPYGTTVVPTVTATPSLSNETVIITPAAAVPGTTTILVTSADTNAQLTYTVTFTVSATQSTDATLSSLKVKGTTISGFRADSLTYNYNVAYADTVIPQVTAELNDATAGMVITQASAVPGTATVVVTAQAGNTQTYTINFIRLSAEKKIKELMLDNWYFAYQRAGNDTVFAHYIAGTTAPLIYSYVVSDGASLSMNLELSTLTVTGADETMQDYPFALTPVTPFVAGTDTILFDGTEDYVVCHYGFDTSKGGYKFSKTDNDYSREWNGKTHVDIFLSEADSVFILGGVSDRKVKVRVNDVIMKEGNIGTGKGIWVPVHRSSPFCLSVISNQSSGDGSVKAILVAHMGGGATDCRLVKEGVQARKFILNGQLVIERDGVRYNAAGQRL